MRCSPEMLQALTCTLPRGFGWHLGNMKKVVSTQEDAHEFALRLLDGCTALDDLLCAHVTSCVTCNWCGSHTEKHFYDQSCVTVAVNTSVQAAVNAYFDTCLNEDYVFECRRCRNNRATKRIALMLPPQFLLVHAARFDSGCNKVLQPMRVSHSLDVRRCIDNFDYLGDMDTTCSAKQPASH
jgi:ubiquitin C-terminal hydrolase